MSLIGSYFLAIEANNGKRANKQRAIREKGNERVRLIRAFLG